MKKPLKNAGLALLAALTPAQALADNVAPAAATDTTIPGWNEFADRLKELGPKMLARLPESMRNDPHVRQEVARLMLESLAAGSIGAISHDPNHPVFLPSLNLTMNIGQPNADTTYKQAIIAPGGTYRLRGNRGTVRIARIGQMGASAKNPSAIQALGYNDINALKSDPNGSYDVILSPERPAGYAGDWWQLNPQTSGLLLRMVSADWAKEKDPTISIERLDVPATKPRPSQEQLTKNLQMLPTIVDRMAILLVDHVPQLVAEGYLHKFKVFDVSQIGGQLDGQFYYETAYDLKDDEALVIESKVPAKCTYYSMILTNSVYETTDWYNNHSSLNDTQLRRDDDGMLRIVVSAKDPGVPNWLDTAGYPQGAIQGRWTECSEQPMPSARKVKLSEITKYLPPSTPKVTPAQRDQIVRDRRAALQQRILW